MRLLRGGFTLIELLVVVAIIGALLGLLLPATNGRRIPARNSMCINNLMQLSKALWLKSEFQRDHPGYINVIGKENAPKIRASWVVTTFPYLDQQELWDKWVAGKSEFSAIDILVCPSDPPVDDSKPNLSYVANTGYIGNAASEENKANGLFFDCTRIADGAPGPSDERDAINQPLLQLNLNRVRGKDGPTLMLTENIHALYWGYVSAEDQQHTKDRNYHFGFCWEQPEALAKAKADQDARSKWAINRNLDSRTISEFAELNSEDGFPSSLHPQVVNFAFLEGWVRSVNQDIDPLVYAQLMTSDRKNSDLANAVGVPEKKLPQPEDNKDY